MPGKLKSNPSQHCWSQDHPIAFPGLPALCKRKSQRTNIQRCREAEGSKCPWDNSCSILPPSAPTGDGLPGEEAEPTVGRHCEELHNLLSALAREGWCRCGANSDSSFFKGHCLKPKFCSAMYSRKPQLHSSWPSEGMNWIEQPVFISMKADNV